MTERNVQTLLRSGGRHNQFTFPRADSKGRRSICPLVRKTWDGHNDNSLGVTRKKKKNVSFVRKRKKPSKEYASTKWHQFFLFSPNSPWPPVMWKFKCRHRVTVDMIWSQSNPFVTTIMRLGWTPREPVWTLLPTTGRVGRGYNLWMPQHAMGTFLPSALGCFFIKYHSVPGALLAARIQKRKLQLPSGVCNPSQEQTHKTSSSCNSECCFAEGLHRICHMNTEQAK